MPKTDEDVERVFSPWLYWSRTQKVLGLWGLVERELRRRGVARMRVYCAWYLKEGKPEAEALIGEREPLADTTASHGLCGTHRRAVEEEIEAIRRKISADAKAREAETKSLGERVDP